MWLDKSCVILTLLPIFLTEIVSLSPEFEAEKLFIQRRTQDDVTSMRDDDLRYNYLEERFKERIDTIPIHLLDDGGTETTEGRDKTSAGIQSVASSKIGTFSPLDCNPVSWGDCSTLVSDNLPAANDPLVVPCGQCYTFDVEVCH